MSRRHTLAVSAAAALLAAGCTSGIAGPPTPASPRSSVTTVSNSDSGRTIHLAMGQRLTVVLSGGYWTFAPSPDPAVLRQDRGPTLLPRSPANCPPGLGCSPIEVRFTAVSPGTTQVRAGRTTCGEALRCTGDRGRFAVTVDVDR
jgi:hypothetical protein